MKKFFLALLVFANISQIAFAQDRLPSVVIINQTRGTECCDPGNTQNFESQLKTAASLELKTTFTLRYDALKDTSFTNLAKKYQKNYTTLFDFGIFLEITPSLAADAGVAYAGTNANWYQAQNSYTVGYTNVQRLKIVDTIFSAYYSVFGTYPQTVTAWILDTQTANYMQQKYNTKVLQLTREQFGTDSYTLYGGPSHYPYTPSKNWIFMPSQKQNNLTVMRQTITDAVLNNGDTHSGSTSQPNDYARSKRTISYFKELLDNALFAQPQAGFALIGLENSMGADVQIEYFLQLQIVADYKNSNKVLVQSATEASTNYTNPNIQVYKGQTDNIKAYNITTPNYRVRLLQKNNSLQITDIRIYSENLQDPYTLNTARREAFFVAPFLIDASRFKFSPIAKTNLNPNEFLQTTQDAFDINQTGITINNNVNCTDNLNSNEYKISCDNLELVFTKDSFILPKTTSYQNYESLDFKIINSDNKFTFNYKDQDIFGLQKNCNAKNCSYKPFLNSTTVQSAYTNLYPFFYPEAVNRKLSQVFTKAYAYNAVALLNRNPIRIIVEPHDVFNFPTILDSEPQIYNFTKSKIQKLGELTKGRYQYIDVYPKKPGLNITNIKITQNNSSYNKNIYSYIALNCKTQTATCILRPDLSLGYIMAKIIEYKYIPRALDN